MCTNWTLGRRQPEQNDDRAAAAATRGGPQADSATLHVLSGAAKPEGR
jgi:hypothetical protein